METLKEKCEALRATTDYRLPKKTYVMVMIDGKNFSRLIKNKYEKPFDDKFINMMNEVAIYVCKNVQGCKFAYTQSDEITFVLTDFENEETSAYFDYRLCKMQSIIASLATAKFNQLVALNLLDTPCSSEDIKQIIKHMSFAQFDCKVWNTDNFNDVFAYFLWRQIDCVRNSKQQAAQTYLSHKELLGKHTDEQVQMLLEKKGIDWNEYSDGKKYGRFIYKEQVEKEIPNSNEETCIRNVWLAHDAFPLFDENGKQKLIDLNIIPLKNNTINFIFI